MSIIRSVISVAAGDKLLLLQFDVSIVILYGLKQAPRCWNKKFDDFLIKEGFKSSFVDPYLYIGNRNGRKLLFFYVDDGLIASTNKEDVEQFFDRFEVIPDFLFRSQILIRIRN